MMTLKTGIEVALQRGCMNTAFEMSRLLLSFDPTDPFGALEYLAYSALRSKHWAWLLEVVEGSLKSYTSDSQAGIPWNNQQVGEYLRDVPSFFFGAALAKFFLESEYAEQKPSKVVKSMTENQKRAYEALDSSTDLLARSILAFPVAASLLVKEVCSDGEPRDPYWKTILEAEDYIRDNVPFESGSFNGNSYAVTAASVFVKLQANIWKPTEIQNLLRSVIDGGLSDYAKRSGKEVSFEVNATDATRVRLPLNPLNFGKSEAVAVPQELLQEMQREDANELDWMFDREVSSGDGSSWEDASDGEDEEWYSVNSDNSDNSGEDEL
ncbi:hypothetical protein AGDE_14819 [Angomonas deanei]|uniref:Transcriptional repressor TCF25, putative n=1 Tax=Angomonas deanei TaxID=59799 RepID=A0A7G2CMI8_9TRYP|nr:hypothetical protein AGDE_14819 [Angomonas deanei]CAD2220277.1 Transcriptional repressor TCF25, putative [Angomonas deanei]|eukprot:EPY20158.1 hypothetical protein AGDE_14819 [Angomonas deanei]